MTKRTHALFSLLCMMFFCFSIVQAASPNDIIGTWFSKGKKKGDDGKITIYKCKNKYCGKISWSESPGDLDENNPNPARRKDKLLGKNIIWGFTFKENKWINGKIYDPRSGKTYKCTMWLINSNKIKVRGYVGWGWASIGEEETWTRVK